MDNREQFMGKACTYVDPQGVEHDGLITAVHGLLEDESAPWSINVLYVAKDASMHDQYGRQIMRESSVPHETKGGASGRFFRL